MQALGLEQILIKNSAHEDAFSDYIYELCSSNLRA